MLMLQAAFLASTNLPAVLKACVGERNKHFVLETTVRFWSEEEFKRNFRVSHTTFAVIACVLSKTERLGINIEYRSIGHPFRGIQD